MVRVLLATREAHPVAHAPLVLTPVESRRRVLWRVELGTTASRRHLEHDALAATDPMRERYHAVGGVLMRYSLGRYSVVVTPQLRKLLLAEAHDTCVSGHRGADKTPAALSEAYYWPNAYADVLRYVTSCSRCQATKPQWRSAPADPHPRGAFP